MTIRLSLVVRCSERMITNQIVALLPPIVISTSMMFMGNVTWPSLMHHLRNSSFVVDVPTRTYFLPFSRVGPFTKAAVTSLIALSSVCFGWNRLGGKDVKFGRTAAFRWVRVEMRTSPLLVWFCLLSRPKIGDQEWPMHNQSSRNSFGWKKIITEARHSDASFASNSVFHNRPDLCSVVGIISDCWSLLNSTAPVLKLYINMTLAKLAPQGDLNSEERAYSDTNSVVRLRVLHWVLHWRELLMKLVARNRRPSGFHRWLHRLLLR